MDNTSEITAPAEEQGVVRAAMVNTDPAPDLVDLIFDYIVAEFPEMRERADNLKEATRREFSGMETYIAHRSPTERQKLVNEVLRLFNGRNAREVARRLQISRATVYRLIKTAGK